MQQALLAAADGPETKRRRTIELANIYDQVAHDPKKGETLLETARKEFPTDVELLGAVAASTSGATAGPAVQVLLDRAAGDARRALSTGRFDVNLFSMLGAVAGCASGTRPPPSPKPRWRRSKGAPPSSREWALARRIRVSTTSSRPTCSPRPSERCFASRAKSSTPRHRSI